MAACLTLVLLSDSIWYRRTKKTWDQIGSLITDKIYTNRNKIVREGWLPIVSYLSAEAG